MSEHQQTIIDMISEAISQKRLIQFYYQNRTNARKYVRTIEPYLVGKRKDGTFFFTGWFIPTSEQPIEGMESDQKQCLLDNIIINNLVVLDKVFNKLKWQAQKLYHTPAVKVICKFELGI